MKQKITFLVLSILLIGLDTYIYGIDDEHYNRRILGDATGEMGPFSSVTYGTQARQISSWYYNDTWFVWNASPWFHRGGDFGMVLLRECLRRFLKMVIYVHGLVIESF